ncbi:UDP-GlcNAc:betaGal beta-1,3-N-acetylglucosaminyltransferase 9 [Bufo gargarizans]|uniref:UDP-GlcNAc:betaGal beta-1,3-N-acetylglucosaminyltransferase 9 n=1 Tax=Bufo gargarizans TaxID=30331 RepID=UPI001CF1AA73|nr:UDP-GlcNAc:betaGal beta-1,3-N-acetylglucosaminyltransferase 9 [Bufo gargarizans]XP_044125826.1 UDP-GlcNAc:betaGal beta-1,3-N-acetylglucosaminyltransferase 9 [Bufo gargarizans]
MKVRLKGEVFCTLFLLIALCTLLYTLLRPTQKIYPAKPKKSKVPLQTVKPKTFLASEDSLSKAKILSVEYNAQATSEEDKPTTSSVVTVPPFDFQQYLRNKDYRNFTLLINQPNKCNKPSGDSFLLIAVKSIVEDFDRRESVRKTWGREALINGVRVRRVFLLGIPRNKTSVSVWESLMQQESHYYKDILLWDFLDTFFNLTLKEIHFLSWAEEYCGNVKFIFKGDADVFVNVENLVNFLQAQDPSEDLFVGDIINNAKPIRSKKSKYYIPETMYGLGMYPAYAGGGGFLMSGVTMKKLSKSCKEVELFPIDDVFLGMCLQRINLTPMLHAGFKTFGIAKPSAAPNLQTFDPCFYRDLMVVHSLKAAEIWLMWNLLHSQQPPCSQRQRIKKLFHWKRKKAKLPIKAITS